MTASVATALCPRHNPAIRDLRFGAELWFLGIYTYSLTTARGHMTSTDRAAETHQHPCIKTLTFNTSNLIIKLGAGGLIIDNLFVYLGRYDVF